MKRFQPFIAVGLALLLASGCSQDSRPPDSGARLLSRDQVHLISPLDFSGKARLLDEMGDFSLTVTPGVTAEVNGAGFRLIAPAGCVSQPVTIQANWLGDEAAPEYGYDFGPAGQEFLLPLQFEVTLPLTPADLPAGDELLVLYDREDGWYEVVSNEVHWRAVEEKVVMRAPLEHFTKYLIGTGPPPDEDGDGN